MSLTPSERVRLVTYIADSLSYQGFTIVDLTLKQFGLPVADRWSGTTHDYVVSMVEDGSDGTLISLAEHLGLKSSASSTPGALPNFWPTGMFRLFISHISEQKLYASGLKTELSPDSWLMTTLSQLESGNCKSKQRWTRARRLSPSFILPSTKASGRIKRSVSSWAGGCQFSRFGWERIPTAS